MKAMACRVCGTRIPQSSIRCPYCYKFQWRGIGMITLFAVVFLSAAGGGTWLMTGPRTAEIQPEAITPFESGSVEPVGETTHPGPAIGAQEDETTRPASPPVEEKRADRLPNVESQPPQSARPDRSTQPDRPAQQIQPSLTEKSAADTASPPMEEGGSPSNVELEKNTAGVPQKQQRQTENAAGASGPQELSGAEPAPAPSEQAPARAARIPLTNDLAGPGPEAENPPADGLAEPEIGTKTPQP